MLHMIATRSVVLLIKKNLEPRPIYYKAGKSNIPGNLKFNRYVHLLYPPHLYSTQNFEPSSNDLLQNYVTVLFFVQYLFEGCSF